MRSSTQQAPPQVISELISNQFEVSQNKQTLNSKTSLSATLLACEPVNHFIQKKFTSFFFHSIQMNFSVSSLFHKVDA